MSDRATKLVLASTLFAAGCAGTRSRDAQRPPSPAAHVGTTSEQSTSTASTESAAPLVFHDDRDVMSSAARIARTGNAHERRIAATQLVAIATRLGSKQWRDGQRAAVARANFQAGLAPTQKQFEVQLDMWQTQRVAQICEAMALFPSTETTEFGFALASDTALPVARRRVGIILLDAVVTPAQAALVARREQLRATITTEEHRLATEPSADAARTVAQMRPGFRRCYNEHLASGSLEELRTKLTLRVAPSGTTESAELNPALPDALAKCITDHARAAGFAPVDSAKPRIIVVPITFVAAQ